MKAIFLDRDGVIIDNTNHYYIFRIEDVIFVDSIFENLTQLKKKGFDFFVVSNQGGIAKKEYTKGDIDKVHGFIQKEMEKHGIRISEFVYCPHHDSVENCNCRKPSPLMIEKLIAKYKINVSTSFLIGDSQRDIDAAKRAGVKGILVPSNKDIKPFIEEIL